MVEAIANGDASAARDAAEHHMERAEKTLLMALRHNTKQ